MEGRTDYVYDLSGQLTRATFPDGRTVLYSYDAAGNRTAVDDGGIVTNYTTDALNQYTTVGAATYTYDLDGNLATKTQGGVTSYTWDAENRLTGVSGPGISQSYEYDAFGNRMAAVQGVTRTEFLLDPFGLGNVVGEYDDLGSGLARYVHGMGLVSRVDDAGLPGF
jgi:YD repeat-containing protein